MTRILSSDSVPAPLLIQLRDWLEAEWGHIDPFEGNHPDVLVPPPIVAVNEETQLLGGMIFGSFVNPRTSDMTVWINAVIIAPNARKKGIASQLVQAAEVEAKRLGVAELSVLSEYPGLYQKLGWEVFGLDSARDETILMKTLVGV